MSKIRIVTVKSPDCEADDCVSKLFRGEYAYSDALAFAARCAELADRDCWSDCIINNDGDLVDSLNDWNDRQVREAGNGCGNPAVVIVSAELSDRYILDVCKGGTGHAE